MLKSEFSNMKNKTKCLYFTTTKNVCHIYSVKKNCAELLTVIEKLIAIFFSTYWTCDSVRPRHWRSFSHFFSKFSTSRSKAVNYVLRSWWRQNSNLSQFPIFLPRDVRLRIMPFIVDGDRTCRISSREEL